jgi:hypothetical protein
MENTRKAKTMNIIPVLTAESFTEAENMAKEDWINCIDALPPMFKNVIVSGHGQVCVARRWSGWSSGWDGAREGIEKPWTWTDTTDRTITGVDMWKPIGRTNQTSLKCKYRQLRCTLDGRAEGQ